MNLIDMAQIWALRNDKDNPWDIFSTLEIDGRIDRDVLVNEIIRRCGSLTPVYNTSETFVYFTNHFFKREYNNIKSMLDLNEKEYEPLENFQRIEKATKTSVSKAVLDESESGSSNDTGTKSDDGSSNDNGTKNDTGNKNESGTKGTNGSKSDNGTITDDGSNEEKNSAYNESVYQPYKKTDSHNSNSSTNVSNYNENNTHNDESSYNDNSIFNNNATYNDTSNFNNNSTYSNKKDYTRDKDYKGEEDTTAHGINGLTTRQDLVLKERQLITFNIVTWIVEKYCMELFLQVF